MKPEKFTIGKKVDINKLPREQQIQILGRQVVEALEDKANPKKKTVLIVKKVDMKNKTITVGTKK